MVIKTRDTNDVTILDVEGDIRRSEPMDTPLHQLVKSLLEDGKRRILLNLEKVENIDSFGVGEILASHISTQNKEGVFKLAKISRKLEFVFKITRLDHVFDIHPDEEAALKSF